MEAEERIRKALEKETLLYQLLKKHAGHEIEIVEYGTGENFSLEDIDTGEVIFDTDIYDLKGLRKDNIASLIEQLISIRDNLKEDLFSSQINALNDACNLILYNFPSDVNVQECIDIGRRKDLT